MVERAGYGSAQSGSCDLIPMMSLQDDWLEYMKNTDAFSYDHFAPLITDTEEPVDLEQAFSSLPNGAELIARIERIRRETAFTGLYHVPAKSDRVTRPVMKYFAEQYAKSVANQLREIGENQQADYIERSPFEFISRRNFKEQEKARTLLFLNADMDIRDNFIDYIYDTYTAPEYFMGLKEAVLFITKVPPVTRYILSAMVEYPVDDEAYYDLWRGGGNIEFCEDKTLIILPDDYEDPITS